jgi:hypothetical protein
MLEPRTMAHKCGDDRGFAADVEIGSGDFDSAGGG